MTLIYSGGFAGTHCELFGRATSQSTTQLESSQLESSQQVKLMEFHPLDDNKLQTFKLNQKEHEGKTFVSCRIVFVESSDFFGRITVYHLDLV